MIEGHGIHVLVDKDYVPLQRKSNDYMMDREAQKSKLYYSGIRGIGMQDASLQESMGPIIDRTRENLVSTDNGLKTLKALEADPTMDLPGLDPEHHKVRSVAILLKRDQHFKDAAREELRAVPGKPHASV
jgi:hypothetical protein